MNDFQKKTKMKYGQFVTQSYDYRPELKWVKANRTLEISGTVYHYRGQQPQRWGGGQPGDRLSRTIEFGAIAAASPWGAGPRAIRRLSGYDAFSCAPVVAWAIFMGTPHYAKARRRGP